VCEGTEHFAQFDVHNASVQNILSWKKAGELAIPEL